VKDHPILSEIGEEGIDISQKGNISPLRKH